MRTLCLIILFCSSFVLDTKGTHIVGGELNYRYLAPNTYEIRLTVYRDCYNGVPPFDDPASVGIFDPVSNVLLQELQMPFVQLDTLPLILDAPCFTPPTNVCYEVTEYVDTITLPSNANGYILAYQRCCRNQTIVNLVLPEETGATYWAYIPPETSFSINSNPKFQKWPPAFLCTNVFFEFDHSAIDYDGDSLSYELFQPYTGADQAFPMPQPPNNPPYTNITWQSPYSTANQMGGSPILTIDPNTGKLSIRPNVTGQFVIGVKCKEFRNGVLVSETLRDYQFNVVECGNVIVASIQSPTITCGTYTASFTNNSSGAVSYLWDFGDPTTTSDNSTLSEPSYTYPDTGSYQVKLIAYGSLTGCNDTSYGIVKVLPAMQAAFTHQINSCTGEVSFVDQSQSPGYPINSWSWNFGDTQVSTLQNPDHTYDSTGTYEVTFIASNVGGCKDTVKTQLLIENSVPQVDTGAVNLCKGSSMQLSASGGVFYSWTPTAGLSNPLIANPFCYPSTTTTYTVYSGMVNSSGDTCIKYNTVNVTVVVPVAGNNGLTITADKDTIVKGEEVTATVQNPENGLTYTWVAGTITKDSVSSFTTGPEKSITIYCYAVDSTGCSRLVDSVRVIVLSENCGEPDVFIPNAFTPNGDQVNDVLKVRGNNITSLYLAIYNRWGEKVFETSNQQIGWDGTYKGRPADPAVFAYYLKVVCAGGETYEKQGNISLIR